MRLATSALLICALAARLGAQSLGGLITRGGLPASDAVVVLLDSSGASVARALSSEGGEYQFAIALPGRYRVRILQIGWRPSTVGPFDVREGAITVASFDVSSQRLSLPAIVVTARAPCRVRPDSAEAAFVVWEQARTALIAATLTRAEALTMSISRTVREYNNDASRLLSDSTTVIVGRTLNPFTSLPPDSIAKVGYIETDADGTRSYWGPDADVLLSDAFISTHCLRVDPSAADAALVGVAFQPSDRRNIADVQGTVWLDRNTSELRSLDFQYVNAGRSVERSGAGGRVDFLHIPGGRWIAERWTIRYPRFGVRTTRTVLPGAAPSQRTEETLSGIGTTSGKVDEVRHGTYVIWERGRVSLNVRVVDSASGAPVAGVLVGDASGTSARATDTTGFMRLERVLPGPLTLKVQAPALLAFGEAVILEAVDIPALNDANIVARIPSVSSLVVAQCGAANVQWGDGMVRGVPRAGSASADSTGVVVAWRTPYRKLGSERLMHVEGERMVAPDSNGRFTLCGVPRDAVVMVRRARMAAAAVTTRFAPGELAAVVAIP